MSKKNEFWASNVSKLNVSLRDLGITIPSMKVVNLLNDKHYNFNIEQLELSATSGSLYNKRDKILIRQVAPEASLRFLSLCPSWLSYKHAKICCSKYD